VNLARVNPRVSIVIPAYNAEQIIQKNLKALASQTYPKNKIEIILVNDHSLDKTQEVAKKISSVLKLNLKVINLKKHAERGVARNIGSKNAKGDYLFFLDADMKLSKKVIEDSVKTILLDPKTKAIIIPEQSFGEGFWTACRALEKKCYIGNDQIEAARFIESKSFWKIGGWDPTMISGEDWDLTRRLREKYQIARIDSLIYHYEGRLTLWNTAKKKYYYGTTLLPYWKKNLVNSSFIFSMVLRPAYFSKWKLLLSDPIHALGMVILKTVEFSAGSLGILRSKLFRPPTTF